MKTLARRTLFGALLGLLICAPLQAQPTEPPIQPTYRLVDGFAPFYAHDRPPPNSWAMPFSHLDLNQAPWVDAEHLERSVERFRRYCQRVAEHGYTAVFVGNLIHLASFDGADGGPVYAQDSPYRERSRIYREAFTRCAQHAKDAGLEFVVETDLPAWSRELRDWLGGEVSLKDPRLWEAYRAAVEELFTEVGVGALSVRIGEGGGAYDEPTGYRSGILVKTVKDTQEAIENLLTIVEGYNAKHGTAKRVLFRTWTIGIGEIGALHTDPELYAKVFEPFYGRPYLSTMIKHVAMDFFAHVPINQTIGVGDLPQVVEFQARREYEAFGLIPNFRAREFAATIRELRKHPNLAGINVWPTNGGFLLPARNFYAVHGATANIDANVFAYSRLLTDPSLDPTGLARDWAVARGASAGDAEVIAGVMARSQEVVDLGLYVGPYAKNAPGLFGVDVFPTMLWVYWNRPTCGYAVQALLARYVGEETATTIQEGRAALDGIQRSIAELEGLSPSPLRDELLESLRYQRSLFRVLAEYRSVFLNHHRWALTGDASAREAWQEALSPLEEAVNEHERLYRDDLRTPAFDMTELRREVRDGRWIPRLQPLAGLVGILSLLWAAGLVLGGLGRLRGGRPLPAPALLVACAALLGGGCAALLQAGYEGIGVGSALGIGFLAGYGVIGGTLRYFAPRPDAPVWEAALLTIAPSLALLGLWTIEFSFCGPTRVHHLLVSALLGGAGKTALLAIFATFLAAFLLSLLLAARRCGAGLGSIPAVLLLVVVLKLSALSLAGAHGIVGINRLLRLGPTVIGEAGTAVEDLLE